MYENEIWKRRPTGVKGNELVAWALTEVAEAIRDHYRQLGTADAATPMGAIEFLGSAVLDGCKDISRALEAVANKV